MEQVILLALVVYGITNIIVRGAIFDPLKSKLEDIHIASKSKIMTTLTGKLLAFMNCPMCTGFWVGVVVGIAYGPFAPWNIIMNGGLFSGTCWILHCITQFLGQGNEPERTLTVYNVAVDDKQEDKVEVLHG